MATHYISPESPNWGGTPRSNSNQYIQDAVDSGSAGDTYVLQTGKHAGQDVSLRSGDTLIFASGAVLTGAENVGKTGWVSEGSGIYSKTIQNGDRQSSGGVNPASGYDPWSLEVMIVDTKLRGWATQYAGIDEDFCYASGSTVYVYGNPAVFDSIEIARHESGISGGATSVRGESNAERALVYGYATDNGGQGGSCLNADGNGSGCVYRNLDVRSCAGSQIGGRHYNEFYNVTCLWAGQLGFFVASAGFTDGVVVGEGCYIYGNGRGGWDNNHEGGNCKFADSENTIIKGSLWDEGDIPAGAGLSPLWFDINNDGQMIYSNVIKDSGHLADRGLMFEISYSGKIYNNILYELGWGQTAEWFFGGLHMDGVGADPPDTVFDDVEIYGNLAYNCSGGLGGCMNRGDSVDPDNRYGPWYNRHWWVHDNTTWNDGSSGQDWWSGYYLPPNSYTSEELGTDIQFDDNIYMVPAADTDFHYAFTPGAGSSSTQQSWSSWNNSEGMDTGPRSQYIIGSSYDPNPFNGGAM